MSVLQRPLLLWLSFLVLFSSLVHYCHSFSTIMTTHSHVLNRVTPEQVGLEIKDPVDPQALLQAKSILLELRSTGPVAASSLLRVAQRLGDLPAEATSCFKTPAECQAAFDALPDAHRSALIRVHDRIQRFAQHQRRSVQDMTVDIPGGQAGHTVAPVSAAGCYAPGGRYPLPSSVLMTAVTARAAGCRTVVLASPKPAQITLAAAHLAQVDFFLCVGGAQAVAAMAYGVMDDTPDHGTEESSNQPAALLVPRCDCICGPGNKWVTAAKSIVNGHCGIDMLAGPSEVLVICDETCRADIVAADLIAQAEHDVVARAILLCTDADTIDAIDQQVAVQIEALPEPNRSTAREALTQSFAVHCDSLDQCVRISDDIAPEHLEIQCRNAEAVGQTCQNYGGLFLGQHAAEVLGDYGAGPNHTLPTGGTGRYTGGLSVFNFLRIRTWMKVDDPTQSQGMVEDSIVLARLEGLEGHARAAEHRRL